MWNFRQQVWKNLSQCWWLEEESWHEGPAESRIKGKVVKRPGGTWACLWVGGDLREQNADVNHPNQKPKDYILRPGAHLLCGSSISEMFGSLDSIELLNLVKENYSHKVSEFSFCELSPFCILCAYSCGIFDVHTLTDQLRSKIQWWKKKAKLASLWLFPLNSHRSYFLRANVSLSKNTALLFTSPLPDRGYS